MEGALKVVARIRSDFSTKFGIPRQSGLVQTLQSAIVFEPEFRSAEALRGIEGFSHLWLIWEFSASKGWSPTVRPPRLGGNRRVGVFASRSPFRPNPLGLSCVKLEGIRHDAADGILLLVSGADLMDGTPIFDIKPYVHYADAHPDALGGFAQAAPSPALKVDCPPELLELLPQPKRQALLEVLALDPRPPYQDDAERIYGMGFSGFDIRFRVQGDTLTVCRILPAEDTRA